MKELKQIKNKLSPEALKFFEKLTEQQQKQYASDVKQGAGIDFIVRSIELSVRDDMINI